MTLFLLIGDQAAQFDKWKDSAQLKQRACFYVFSRHEDGQLPTGIRHSNATDFGF